MTIAKRLKDKRIALGLTMKQVADRVGVSEGSISRWESGDIYNMRRDKIYELSKVLGVSPLLIVGFAPEDIEDLHGAGGRVYRQGFRPCVRYTGRYTI